MCVRRILEIDLDFEFVFPGVYSERSGECGTGARNRLSEYCR